MVSILQSRNVAPVRVPCRIVLLDNVVAMQVKLNFWSYYFAYFCTDVSAG